MTTKTIAWRISSPGFETQSGHGRRELDIAIRQFITDVREGTIQVELKRSPQPFLSTPEEVRR